MKRTATRKNSAAPAQGDDEDAEQRRKREEHRRLVEANERERVAARRDLLTVFKLWKVCPGKACARARACRGDTEVCLRDRWRVHVPAEIRTLVGKAMQFCESGLSWPDAVAAAQADLAHRAELSAKFAAQQAAAKPVAEPPAAAPAVRRSAPPRLYGPRVRRL